MHRIDRSNSPAPAEGYQERLVRGVRRISRSPSFPRPWVGILAALHGNEPAGIAAHRYLDEAAGHFEGTLFLIEGNLEAIKIGERHTRGGVDLNRIFDLSFAGDLSPEHYDYEHHRALELTPILDSLDAALDLHTATAETPPFALALGPQTPIEDSFFQITSLEVADTLPVRFVTYGWEERTDISAGVALARVSSRGPSIAVECGSHGSSGVEEVAIAITQAFLRALGVSKATQTDWPPPRTLELTYALLSRAPRLRFRRTFSSFDALVANEVVGDDEEGEFRTPHGGTILLPNPDVDVGAPCLYIAEER